MCCFIDQFSCNHQVNRPAQKEISPWRPLLRVPESWKTCSRKTWYNTDLSICEPPPQFRPLRPYLTTQQNHSHLFCLMYPHYSFRTSCQHRKKTCRASGQTLSTRTKGASKVMGPRELGTRSLLSLLGWPHSSKSAINRQRDVSIYPVQPAHKGTTGSRLVLAYPL